MVGKYPIFIWSQYFLQLPYNRIQKVKKCKLLRKGT